MLGYVPRSSVGGVRYSLKLSLHKGDLEILRVCRNEVALALALVWGEEEYIVVASVINFLLQMIESRI